MTKDDIGRVFKLYDRVINPLKGSVEKTRSFEQVIAAQCNEYLYFITQDNSGDIENEELSGFLKDLLDLVKTVRNFEILSIFKSCRYMFHFL